jgi:hypothetical protein
MTALGHNNPPAHEAFALHIEELFKLVSDTAAGGCVETDEQDAALEGLLDDVRKARKDADAERAAEKKPHDDAAKAVQAKWKPLLDRCDIAADEIKRLLTPYRTAKQRAKDEAARKARAEAEAKQRAAQEALRQSDDLQAKYEAEATLKQATKLAAAANRIDREATGLRTVYRTEITDMTALSRWAWINRRDEYEAFLTQLAEREGRRGPVAIPGIIVHTERKAA